MSAGELAQLVRRNCLTFRTHQSRSQRSAAHGRRPGAARGDGRMRATQDTAAAALPFTVARTPGPTTTGDCSRDPLLPQRPAGGVFRCSGSTSTRPRSAAASFRGVGSAAPVGAQLPRALVFEAREFRRRAWLFRSGGDRSRGSNADPSRPAAVANRRRGAGNAWGVTLGQRLGSATCHRFDRCGREAGGVQCRRGTGRRSWWWTCGDGQLWPDTSR